MTVLIENVRPELGFESFFKEMAVDRFLPDEELHVGAIAPTISAKLCKRQVVNLKGSKPEMFQSSWSDLDEPRCVALRVFRHGHAIEVEFVLTSDLASLTRDSQEVLPPLAGLDLDEVNVSGWSRKPPKNGKNKPSQAMGFDRPVKSAINVAEEGEPRRRDPSGHRAGARPSGR